MNIYEAYKCLIDLYDDYTHNLKLYENLIGNIRISVSEKRANIRNLEDNIDLLTLIDCGTLNQNIEKYHRIYCGDYDKGFILIRGIVSTEIEIITDIFPTYLPSGEKPEIPIIDYEHFREEEHFQLSTVFDIPDYDAFCMVKKYTNIIAKKSYMYNYTVLSNLNYDWNDIPLTYKDFQ